MRTHILYMQYIHMHAHIYCTYTDIHTCMFSFICYHNYSCMIMYVPACVKASTIYIKLVGFRF